MNNALPWWPLRAGTRRFGFTSVLLPALLLSACGGSGNGTSTPPPASGLTAIAGTAAASAAIVNAPVDVKCGGGVMLVGVVSTGTDGKYNASVSGATLPCVVRVTSGDTVLHSVVASGTGTVTANITPVTELVTANVAGGGSTPDALYNTFDASAQAKVTPTTLGTAISTVTAALAGTVDLTGTDPIGGTLVAAHGGTAANSLGAQSATLTTSPDDAGVTLAALDTAVSTATPATPPLVHALATADAICAALRSGTYRLIDPSSAVADPGFAAYRMKVDATARTATDVEPGHTPDVTTLVPVSGSPCNYTYAGDNGTGTVLVSTGGAFVIRAPSPNGQVRVLFMIPEQVVPLSRLAGTWNFIDYSGDDNDTPPLTSAYGTRVVDASGNFSGATQCTGASCGTSSQTTHFTIDPAGGYDLNSGGSRAFAWIADNGTLAIFGFDVAAGSFDVMTLQKSLPLPKANDVDTFWDFTAGNGNFEPNPTPGASDLSDFTITVTSVDTAAQSFTRVRSSDGRVDSIEVNTPSIGLRTRPATGTAAAAVQLVLPGEGLTFYCSASDTTDFFGISVNHP